MRRSSVFGRFVTVVLSSAVGRRVWVRPVGSYGANRRRARVLWLRPVGRRVCGRCGGRAPGGSRSMVKGGR